MSTSTSHLRGDVRKDARKRERIARGIPTSEFLLEIVLGSYYKDVRHSDPHILASNIGRDNVDHSGGEIEVGMGRGRQARRANTSCLGLCCLLVGIKFVNPETYTMTNG